MAVYLSGKGVPYSTPEQAASATAREQLASVSSIVTRQSKPVGEYATQYGPINIMDTVTGRANPEAAKASMLAERVPDASQLPQDQGAVRYEPALDYSSGADNAKAEAQVRDIAIRRQASLEAEQAVFTKPRTAREKFEQGLQKASTVVGTFGYEYVGAGITNLMGVTKTDTRHIVKAAKEEAIYARMTGNLPAKVAENALFNPATTVVGGLAFGAAAGSATGAALLARPDVATGAMAIGGIFSAKTGYDIGIDVKEGRISKAVGTAAVFGTAMLAGGAGAKIAKPSAPKTEMFFDAEAAVTEDFGVGSKFPFKGRLEARSGKSVVEGEIFGKGSVYDASEAVPGEGLTDFRIASEAEGIMEVRTPMKGLSKITGQSVFKVRTVDLKAANLQASKRTGALDFGEGGRFAGGKDITMGMSQGKPAAAKGLTMGKFLRPDTDLSVKFADEAYIRAGSEDISTVTGISDKGIFGGKVSVLTLKGAKAPEPVSGGGTTLLKPVPKTASGSTSITKSILGEAGKALTGTFGAVEARPFTSMSVNPGSISPLSVKAAKAQKVQPSMRMDLDLDMGQSQVQGRAVKVSPVLSYRTFSAQMGKQKSKPSSGTGLEGVQLSDVMQGLRMGSMLGTLQAPRQEQKMRQRWNPPIITPVPPSLIVPNGTFTTLPPVPGPRFGSSGGLGGGLSLGGKRTLRYTPTVIGVLSGRRIKQEPVGDVGIQSVGIRYPVEKKKMPSLFGSLFAKKKGKKRDPLGWLPGVAGLK